MARSEDERVLPHSRRAINLYRSKLASSCGTLTRRSFSPPCRRRQAGAEAFMAVIHFQPVGGPIGRVGPRKWVALMTLGADPMRMRSTAIYLFAASATTPSPRGCKIAASRQRLADRSSDERFCPLLPFQSATKRRASFSPSVRFGLGVFCASLLVIASDPWAAAAGVPARCAPQADAVASFMPYSSRDAGPPGAPALLEHAQARGAARRAGALHFID